MRKFPLLLVLLCFSLTAQQTTTLETETGTIEGTLLIPDDADNPPVVLIIAGSGPTDRNGNNTRMVNNHLKLVAEGLAENGIASLRFDKRGIGGSAKAMSAEKDLRFTTYIDDAAAWAKQLEEDDRFSKTYILGHSEGSLIGMLAARKSDVDGYISLAGAGVRGSELIRDQLKPQGLLEQADPALTKLENGEMVEEVPAGMEALFRPSVQPYLISWFQYDPTKEIAELDVPTLIVQGTTDIQVTVEDAEKLAGAATDAEKHIIEGMNHILKDASANQFLNVQTYYQADLPLNKELIPILTQFIKS